MRIDEPIHEYSPELTIEWLTENCPLDHRLTRLMNIDWSVIRCRESKAVITASLFNRNTDDFTGMTRNSEQQFRKRYFASLVNNIQWLETTDMSCELFVEPSIADEVMRHITSAKVNMHVMTEDSLAATGMFWRFLSFDFNDEWRPDETILCDIDLEWKHHVPLLREHCPVAPVFYTRTGEPFKQTDECYAYTPVSCGYSSFIKSDLEFKMSEIIPRFLWYQYHMQHNEPRTIWNGPTHAHIWGVGNTWNIYGSDERFFAKVVRYYLRRKGRLSMMMKLEGLSEPHPPEQADLDFATSHGNSIIGI